MEAKRIHWQFPPKAKFGRSVPKSKIYEHGKVKQRTKDQFVTHIEKIEWAYKLAESTINLTACEEVPEIQVFRLYLKDIEHSVDTEGISGLGLSNDVLSAIDSAIPFPIIFEIHRGHGDSGNHKMCYAACHKTPKYSSAKSNTTSQKTGSQKADKQIAAWHCSDYVSSEWVKLESGVYESKATTLPALTSLAALYRYFLAELSPVEPSANEDIGETMERIEQIKALKSQVEKLKNKQKKEQQFNRRVEINRQIKELGEQVQKLERAK